MRARGVQLALDIMECRDCSGSAFFRLDSDSANLIRLTTIFSQPAAIKFALKTIYFSVKVPGLNPTDNFNIRYSIRFHMNNKTFALPVFFFWE